MGKLQILTYNARSLKDNRAILEDLAAKHQIDVLLVQETRAKDTPDIRGYTGYSLKWQAAAGGPLGLSTYIKTGITRMVGRARLARSKRQNSHIPALQRPDGTRAETEAERAEALVDRYLYVHKMTEDLGNPTAPVEEVIRRYLRGCAPDSRLKTTAEELESEIKKLKVKKAPGADGIPNAAIKHLPPKIVQQTAVIFNECLKKSYFPSIWKTATIQPIPKPGKDPTLPASHRPISLLSNLGKLLERIIAKRLTEYLEENDLLNVQQYGFRRQHSTTHALMEFSDVATLAMSLGKHLGAVLLDASEAFPTMNHALLLHKMAALKFSPATVKLVKRYLEDRPFTVRVGEAQSTRRIMPQGTPQGSCLGPLLFIIYINSIKGLDSLQILYADDTTIYDGHKKATELRQLLQNKLDRVARYMDRSKIQLNAAKTQAIIITRRRTEKDPGGPYAYSGRTSSGRMRPPC
ncbi:hypothetical protein ONE63_011104 [Megalurothrips usitatus]|uniref:Reverse transcriptase domain-containing protein n=1 Tax=Megalurothrips usitatus TaxID=439358 RepID=A0AAV7XJP0_9NEOP|nr:hypothetical protein ONE63_011104 [Megalurothrips usitatus]